MILARYNHADWTTLHASVERCGVYLRLQCSWVFIRRRRPIMVCVLIINNALSSPWLCVIRECDLSPLSHFQKRNQSMTVWIRYVYLQGEYKIWYIHTLNHEQFQTIIVLVITRPAPISFGDLYIQRYIPFKKRGEKQAGPLFTIVNCVDGWMIALELDQCVFTSILFKWLYLWM